MSSSQHEQQNQEGPDPELLREIVEASDDGIYTRTLDGIITSWSPGAARISGYSAEEIVGKSITIFTTTESVLTATESVLRGDSLLMGDVECVRKDGRHVILSTGIAPLKDRQGTIVGISGVMRDVTDRKKAEDQLRFQAQLLDAVGQAVIATDPDGRIMYWNSAAAELYGYQADEAMGRDATFLLPDDVSRSLGQTVRSQLLTHGSWFGEHEVRRRDGTVVPVFTTIGRIGDTDGEALSVIGVSTNITERKKAEEAARSAEQRYRALFIASPIGIELVNAEGVLTETNPAFQEMLGYSTQELVGHHWTDITHPDDVYQEAELDREMDAGTRSRYQLEKRFVRKDGETIWARLSSSDVGRIAAGDFQFTIGMVEDITDQKRAQGALQESEERYRKLVDLLPEGVWLLRDGRTVVFANQAAARLHGARCPEDLIGLDVMTFLGPNTFEMAVAVTEKRMRGELPAGQFVEYELRRLDGTTFQAEVVTVPLPTPTGDALLMSVERDVTEQRAYEAQLEHLALHDPLTDVANRTLFMDRLDHALRTASRKKEQLAIFVLGLDQFSEVNDAYGHDCGDAVLQEVAQRLSRTLRKSDTIARLGGDEFALILPSVDLLAALEAVIKIAAALQRTIEHGDQRFHVSASIGLVLAPDHGEEAETLVRRANAAMYTAKHTNSGYAVYSPDKDTYSPLRVVVINELRAAIEHDQLLLHFQPKLNLTSGLIQGVEALVRWNHPSHGVIPPDRFISIAEHSGLIRPLTNWVIRNAAEQCGQWRALGLDLGIAVNLSVQSLHDPDLPHTLEQHLMQTGVPAARLTLEITESILMADPERAMEVLLQLKELGIRISIDDFGIGYSSLAYLRQLRFDELKIDKSFVMDLTPPGTEEQSSRLSWLWVTSSAWR